MLLQFKWRQMDNMKKLLFLMIILLNTIGIESNVCERGRTTNCCKLHSHQRRQPYMRCIHSKSQRSAQNCCARNGTWIS